MSITVWYTATLGGILEVFYHMANSKASNERARWWSFIVYPDSAPQNWIDLLNEQQIQWIKSPLHEFDTNPDGELKKAHWHCLMYFSGKKSYDQVCEILKPLNCPIPQICQSQKGAVRYMAHLDNPEKHQYAKSDIVSFGGLDVDDLIKPTSTDRYRLIREMQQFVKAEHITEFQDLADYAAEERFDDWYPLICDSAAYIIGQYIKSQRNRQDMQH